jgi:hypothetical protein
MLDGTRRQRHQSLREGRDNKGDSDRPGGLAWTLTRPEPISMVGALGGLGLARDCPPPPPAPGGPPAGAAPAGTGYGMGNGPGASWAGWAAAGRLGSGIETNPTTGNLTKPGAD